MVISYNLTFIVTQTHPHQDVWLGQLYEVKVCDIGIFGPRRLSTEKAFINTQSPRVLCIRGGKILCSDIGAPPQIKRKKP